MRSEQETLIIVGDFHAKVNWLIEKAAGLFFAESAGLNSDAELDGRSDLLASQKGKKTALINLDLGVESGAEAMVQTQLDFAELFGLKLELLLQSELILVGDLVAKGDRGFFEIQIGDSFRVHLLAFYLTVKLQR